MVKLVACISITSFVVRPQVYGSIDLMVDRFSQVLFHMCKAEENEIFIAYIGIQSTVAYAFSLT